MPIANGGMYFEYGPYTHPPGEVAITNMSVRRHYSERNRAVFYIVTMEISGHICGPSAESLGTRIQEIYDAYEFDIGGGSGYGAGLRYANGNKTPHYMHGDQSINGIKVLTIDFPESGPGEMATVRTYRIVLQAEFLTVEDPVEFFEERVTTVGGAPIQPNAFLSWWRWIHTPFAYDRQGRNSWGGFQVPIRQAVSDTKIVIQEGSSVGINGYAPAPLPIWPDYEIPHERVFTFHNPTSFRRGFLHYRMSWKYTMQLPIYPITLSLPNMDY